MKVKDLIELLEGFEDYELKINSIEFDNLEVKGIWGVDMETIDLKDNQTPTIFLDVQ